MFFEIEICRSIDVGRCFRSRGACIAGSMPNRKGQGTVGSVGVVVNASDGGEQMPIGTIDLAQSARGKHFDSWPGENERLLTTEASYKASLMALEATWMVGGYKRRRTRN